jgi:hypothetical protein
MNAFLSSVKDDLLDVRLRLAVLVLAVALVAAVAYAVLGGGSSSVPTSATTAPVVASAGGISISQTTANAAEPVTETTDGAAHQRGGSLRDPFTPLAGSAAKSSATTTTTPSASTTTPASSGSGTSTSGGSSTPVATTKPSAPSKPKVTTRFEVTAEFGVLPAPSIVGAPVEAQLKTYSDMALDEPLPDKSNAQLVFSGAVKRTKLEAVFTLTGESILHGNATCLPSPTQCQAIRLQVGQSETLESIEPDGSPVTYELRLVAVTRITRTVSSASAARAHVASAADVSKVGSELLRRKHLTTVSGLEYSPSEGVLVPAGKPAPAVRAHVAAQRPRHGR